MLLPGRRFIRVDETAGWPLLVSAVLALLWANSPWHDVYRDLWNLEIEVGPVHWALSRTLRDWVTDLLLPLFFFVIGMEIKEELLRGELSRWSRAVVPAVAAVGGMAVPAVLYLLVNLGGRHMNGWGVPVATDIAFAIGIVTLLGRRIPDELKVLLLAFAAVDDMGGTLIIAFYYSQGILWTPLLIAAALLMLLFGAKALGITGATVYILLGVAFLFAFMASGVHPTVAGVILGLMIPVGSCFSTEDFEKNAHALLKQLQESRENRAGDEDAGIQRDILIRQIDELATGTESPVSRIQRSIYPWVSYLVLPLFALGHAGLEISAKTLVGAVSSRMSLGILAGLIVGKPVGIIGSIWLIQKTGLGQLSENLRWRHIVGMGLVAGIGFTISLFIAELAFQGEGGSEARLAVLLASTIAAIIGSAFLLIAADKSNATEESQAS